MHLLVVAVVTAVVVLAGYATYAAYLARPPGGEPTLTVYTYESFFGGGCGAGGFAPLLAQFESAHHAHVSLVCPSGTLVSQLLAEKNAPVADVVLGLDEITGPQAEANGLLVPYQPPGLADVNSSLVGELGSGHDLTPYEWGYLAFDYNLSFGPPTGGAVTHATFSDFAENASWASNLVVEDPTVDITGEEFLLWEIAYMEEVAHQDWSTWWASVDPHVRVAPDWSTAFQEFSTPPNNPALVVSYSTDPAYTLYYSGTPTFNSSVSWNGSVAYGWKAIYGAGIVNGTHQQPLAEAFIDWMLSPAVQGAIPTNEWEYPANGTVGVPPVFAAAIDPSGIVALNSALPPATILSSLPGWLEEWQTLANQYG